MGVATAPVYEKKYARRSPASINWRDTEAITAIKNQGQCGSCWAFSATEAIESQLVLTTGREFALELSPQQIASCTPSSQEASQQSQATPTPLQHALALASARTRTLTSWLPR